MSTCVRVEPPRIVAAPRASSLVDVLRFRASETADRWAYSVPCDEGSGHVELTYGWVDRRARAIGGYLQLLGLSGQCAVLLYPAGMEFIAAFFGCLYADVVAVPANMPRSKRDIQRVQNILTDSRASVALTLSSEVPREAGRYVTHLGDPLPLCIATDVVPDDAVSLWREPNTSQDTLAYLQYTSGSTGDPRGVMISHGNVLHNLGYIDRGFQHTKDSLSVSWLPHFHDMGLVYGIIQPLYNGFPAVLMSPMEFMQRPGSWLEAISAYQCTHSGGPNFAYDLCVRSVTPEQRKSLDLSSWRVAFNGAEQVRPDTIGRFVEAFGPCGFSRNSFYPAYGLAEATLKVTGGLAPEPPRIAAFQGSALEDSRVVESAETTKGARTLVACGSASGTTLAIVDPTTLRRCQQGRVGEIWVSGPGVAMGYWNRPRETSETFQARLADSTAPQFLRTGDLGFLHEGDLFIAGRLKDLIIIRGHNYYPQDIELTVETCHPALRPGAGAAFPVDLEGRERLVIVHEIERTWRNPNIDEIGGAIRRAVAEQHQLQPYLVALVRPGTIPRTSSGKLQRRRCRADFLANRLRVVGLSPLPEEEFRTPAPGVTRSMLLELGPEDRRLHVESYLRSSASQALGIAEELVDWMQPLVGLGLDSLMAAQLRDRLERELDVAVPVIDLLRGLNVRDAAGSILSQLANAGVGAGSAGASEPAPARALASPMGDERPLSWEQERLWFLNELAPGNPVYNIPCAMLLDGSLDVPALARALAGVVKRHEPLRANFETRASRPVQTIVPCVAVPVRVVDLSGLPPATREVAGRRLASEHAQRPFDLARDLLLQVLLVRFQSDAHLLILVVHHIVFDGRSLALFLEEMGALYNAFVAGRSMDLAELTFRYRDAVGMQRSEESRLSLEGHLRYWEEALRPARHGWNLPTAQRGLKPARGRAGQMTFELPDPLTASIVSFSRRKRLTVFMALLAPFTVILARSTRERRITIGVPTHGRFSDRTAGLVGLFSYPLPFSFDFSDDLTLQTAVERVRERVLEACEHEQVPFAKIVEVAKPDRRASHMPLFSVMFSFIKHPLSGLALSKLAIHPVDIQVGRCEFDLWLTMVEEAPGRLTGSLSYNRDCFTPEAVRELVTSYQNLLRAQIADDDTPIARHELQLCVETPASDAHSRPGVIAIASSFTAQTLAKPLEFWMKYWGFPLATEFAAYNQIFQQLLDDRSLLRTNTRGVNIIALRLEDWRSEQKAGDPTGSIEVLRKNVDDLIVAVKTASSRSSVPYLVCLCPSSPQLLTNREIADAFDELEQRLISGVRDLGGVYVLTTTELNSLYPVPEYYDAYQYELSRCPFTEAFSVALGTLLARKIYALEATPYKVVVLDCDNTLWLGTCGEGHGGIQLDHSSRLLQEFMVGQRASGMLLCVCSKNNEPDVFRVFDEHPEMPLRPDDLVAWRINWKSKSENLKSLAEELRLGLDTFIFVDDSPFECAEVKTNCPGVLALQVPAPDQMASFLRHLWVFDHLKPTPDDALRAQRYKESRLRARASAEGLPMEAFLESLELRVGFAAATSETWARVAQLVQRTNQFNLTGARRSESELRMLCSNGQRSCLTVEASDRFGDYGLVGVVIYELLDDALWVDTFLLSCRALGRRIEFVMLNRLAEIAQNQHRGRIDIPFVPTTRNQPGREFLEAIGSSSRELRGDYWVFGVPVTAATTPVAS